MKCVERDVNYKPNRKKRAVVRERFRNLDAGQIVIAFSMGIKLREHSTVIPESNFFKLLFVQG